MQTTKHTRLAAAIVLSGLALTACGDDSTRAAADAAPAAAEAGPGTVLTVEDPWVRATSGTDDPSMTAAFMVLDNEGEEEVVVTGASSPVAPMVQLHETTMVDGASVMREIDGGIALPPGRGQLLQPGGTHVMLMGLTDELAAGDEVELVLELGDGSSVEVTAPVKVFTEEAEHYHAPGTSEEHGHQ